MQSFVNYLKWSDLKWNAERQKMWYLWRCYWDECLENFLWFVINHQDWLHANTKLSKEPAEGPRRSVWKVTETYLRAVIHTWRKHVLNLPRTDQPTAKTCRPFESRHICIRRTAFHKESVQQQPDCVMLWWSGLLCCFNELNLIHKKCRLRDGDSCAFHVRPRRRAGEEVSVSARRLDGRFFLSLSFLTSVKLCLILAWNKNNSLAAVAGV